jgi:hypothetical protein
MEKRSQTHEDQVQWCRTIHTAYTFSIVDLDQASLQAATLPYVHSPQAIQLVKHTRNMQTKGGNVHRTCSIF